MLYPLSYEGGRAELTGDAGWRRRQQRPAGASRGPPPDAADAACCTVQRFACSCQE